MKHIQGVSFGRENASALRPNAADAKGDFLDAIFRAWQDFVFAKKNEAV